MRRDIQVFSTGKPADVRGWRTSRPDGCWVIGFLALCVRRMARHRPHDGIGVIIRTPTQHSESQRTQ